MTENQLLHQLLYTKDMQQQKDLLADSAGSNDGNSVTMSEKVKYCSFEEFKLYYESAERVTDRRLSNNNWNYSICTAILVAIAAGWSWSVDKREYIFVVFNLVSILSFVAFFFSSLWIQQIKDFKSLNNAKFVVLNDMAKRMSFGDKVENDFEIQSFDPFTREWDILQRSRAARKGRYLQIVALRSSDAEFFVPNAFRFIFLILLIISLIPTVLKWDLQLQAWQRFLGL